VLHLKLACLRKPIVQTICFKETNHRDTVSYLLVASEEYEMNSIYRFLLVPIILILAGCDAVYTPEPLGDNAVQLSVEEWQGTWLASEMVVITTVLDKDKGRLQVAWMERGTDGVEMEVLEGSIRASGDIMFTNTRDDNPNVGPRYLWMVLDKSEGHFTVWSANLKQFKAMVADGRLPGEETDDGVVLGELKREHVEMIIDPSTNLLDWKNPGVFIRVGD